MLEITVIVREILDIYSLNFLQTGYAVNGAGTILAAASVKYVLEEGALWPEEVFQTYVFDLEKNTLTSVECKKTDLVPCQVLANGEILASTPAMGEIPPRHTFTPRAQLISCLFRTTSKVFVPRL